MGSKNSTISLTITCTFEELAALLSGNLAELTVNALLPLLRVAHGQGMVSGAADDQEASTEVSPEILVDALCRECEGSVDPLTRRHVNGDGKDCRYDDVPEQDLDVALLCPACGAQEISEVNIGEIWDEVTQVSFESGILTITVDQLSEMDRNGDGWVCARCAVRLRLPIKYLIGFEYE